MTREEHCIDRARTKQRLNPGQWIERARVAPILEAWLADHKANFDSTGSGGMISFGHKRDIPGWLPAAGGQDVLSSMTRVSTRQIYGIIHGDAILVSLNVVDRLLTGLDMVHLFYMPPEAGGFSDVYFHEAVVGRQEELAAA
jgi:hypothetical protein